MDKHIEKILHKSNYKINNGIAYNRIYESPYSINIDDMYINEDDEDDEVVELDNTENNDETNSNQDDASNSDDIDSEDVDDSNTENNADDTDTNNEVNSEIDVIKQHNDIIKSTLKNLKDVYSKIGDIDMFIRDMESKIENISNSTHKNQQTLDYLSKTVEEMREPTNKEKLEKAKFDSAPFSNNMNDIWGSKKYITNNIMKLKDGTFIGVFDNFENINNINDSFYEYE